MLVGELRLRQENLENDRFELAMLKKSGVVNSLRNERIPLKDTPAKGAASFMQMLSRDLGDGFAPMFDDASKVLSSLWGNDDVVDRAGDDGGGASASDNRIRRQQQQQEDELATVDAEIEGDIPPEEVDLGVLICAMPQKKSE